MHCFFFNGDLVIIIPHYFLIKVFIKDRFIKDRFLHCIWIWTQFILLYILYIFQSMSLKCLLIYQLSNITKHSSENLQ